MMGKDADAAQYDNLADEITFNTRSVFPFLERSEVGPLESFLDAAGVTLRGAIIHELAHDYSTQVAQYLNREDTLHTSFSDRSEHGRFKLHFLMDAIAHYFAVEMGEFRYNETTWPKDSTGFQDAEDVYNLGYFMVKPILNKAGVKKGIEGIFSSPCITDDELYDPVAYQTRILSNVLNVYGWQQQNERITARQDSTAAR